MFCESGGEGGADHQVMDCTRKLDMQRTGQDEREIVKPARGCQLLALTRFDPFPS
jgi:hypothetical protein